MAFSRLFAMATTGLGGAAVGGLCLLGMMLFNLYRKQESLLYYPVIPGLLKRVDDNPPPFNSPAGWGLRHDELHLTTADGVRIHGWFVYAEGGDPTRAPTIVFCHANAGNMGFRLPNVAMLAQGVGANCLIFDYRGYGNSEGSPTEGGLELDAEAVLAYLSSRPDVDQGRVFLFGRSLGGAVAVRAAVNRPHPSRALAGLVLENTFTCIGDMVDTVMPLLAPFKRLVLRMHWPTVDLLPRLPPELPILLIGGTHDALVPPAQMRRLQSAARARGSASEGGAPDTCVFYEVPGGSHDDCAVKGGAEYVATLRKFISSALRARAGSEGYVLPPPQPVRVPPGVPPQIVPGAAASASASNPAAAGGNSAEQDLEPSAEGAEQDASAEEVPSSKEL